MCFDSLTVVSMVSQSMAGRLRTRSFMTFRQDRYADDKGSPTCRCEAASCLHVDVDIDREWEVCCAARCRVYVFFPALPGRQYDWR